MNEEEFNELITDEEEFSSLPQSLKTGAAGNYKEERQVPVGQNPNATRWLFNPFMVINLMNEGASCGFLFLQNIMFNRVRSISTNLGKDFEETGQSPLTPGHNANNYTATPRTSYMIAEELTRKHGEKGVIEISRLTGKEDEAAELNTFLFGDEVECVMDMNYPEHPVPLIANLLEKLSANVQGANPETLTIARQVRSALQLSMRYARTRIDDAQKRMLEKGNPNKTLSADEQRCYLALGEEIPNQMPFLTKAASAGQGQGIDEHVLANAVSAGVKAALTPPTPPKSVKVANKAAESVPA
jgi:hypothetical protein